MSCYISPLQFNPGTGQYTALGVGPTGTDLSIHGYINGLAPTVRQNTRAIQSINRRFANHIPTTLSHTVVLKEFLRRGNANNYSESDQSLAGSMLIQAASISPYMKVQITTGTAASPGLGTTWLFYGVWTDLENPIDDDGPQVVTLSIVPIDPGYAGSSSGPQSPVIYYQQSYSYPYTP